MDTAWQVLIDAGLPLTGARGHPPAAREMALAVRALLDTPHEPRERDALAAFLIAWRDHWPTSFASELGDDAARAESWARGAIEDRNRMVKLRRIAIERLATVL